MRHFVISTLVAAVAATTAPAGTQRAPLTAPGLTTHTLPNGVTVYTNQKTGGATVNTGTGQTGTITIGK